MKKNKWYLHPAFYIVIILYFILGFSTLLFGEKWGNLFFLEDTYFENVGALSLGIAAVISFYIFMLALKNRKTTNFHCILGWLRCAAPSLESRFERFPRIHRKAHPNCPLGYRLVVHFQLSGSPACQTNFSFLLFIQNHHLHPGGSGSQGK